MSVKPGAYLGGIRTLSDVRDRCYIDDFGCWCWRMCHFRRAPNAEWVDASGVRKRGPVRRIAWILSGREVPDGHIVTIDKSMCPRTDCVNPKHMQCITRKGFCTLADPLAKARHRRSVTKYARGRSSLSPEDVQAIKDSPASSYVEAEKWGLNPSTVQCIRNGKTWREGLLA